MASNDIGVNTNSSGRILQRLSRTRWPTDEKAAKYVILRNALLAAITGEQCKMGDLLPTEAALSETTPFSLGTVQRAIRALVDDRIVARRKGYGTYVVGRPREMPHPLQCRFFADDGVTFLPIYPRVLERVRIAQRGPWSAVLGQKRDNVLRIDRIIDVASEFTVFARFHTRADRYPRLESVPTVSLDGESLTRLIMKPNETWRFEQTCRAETFSDWICVAIGIPTQTTGLVLTTIARSGDTAIYHQDLHVPPTRFRLKVS
jgi:DNA-binding GntR family transcriptional regulator